MLVFLNLQQVDVIVFKNTLLCLPLKKRNCFSTRISMSIEKSLLCWSSYRSLLYIFKLFNKYCTLASHHYTYNFFAIAGMFLHEKTTLYYFNFERQGSYLQVLRMLVNIHFGPPCNDDSITRKKSPGAIGFLVSKSKLSVMKNIPPSWEGKTFT